MICKIVSMKHTGTKGPKGEIREDYNYRLNRIGLLVGDSLEINRRGMMWYDDTGKGSSLMYTSPIVNISPDRETIKCGDRLTLTTENTEWEFEVLSLLDIVFLIS